MNHPEEKPSSPHPSSGEERAGAVGEPPTSACRVCDGKDGGEASCESECGLERLIVEHSSDCIKVLDLDGNLLRMGAAGRNMFGITDIGKHLGKSWIDLWDDEEDQEAATAAMKTATEGGTGRFVGRSPSEPGRARWWDVVVSPMPGAGGSTHRLLAVSRDVTERHRSELNFSLLFSVSQDLAQPESVAEVMRRVAERIGKYMNLTMCAFVEIDATVENFAVTHEWHREGVDSLCGEHAIGEYLTDDLQEVRARGKP
jgi:PAS domain S-box-containing protein